MSWPRLITSLCDIESNANPDAVGDGGLAVGILQAHPDVITDVNNIYGTQFTNADRNDIDKSKAIFVMYVTWYCRYERLGREATLRDYALCWHYGPSFMRIKVSQGQFWTSDPDGYWDKVLKHV